MDWMLFGQALTLGFGIAAPVGPIGLLVIRRSLNAGWMSGLASGFGAATADAIYGALAVLGMSGLVALLVGQVFWLRLLGGLALCWIGFSILRARQATQGTQTRAIGRGLLSDFGSTFGLTLTNPMTILSFAGLFAGFFTGQGLNSSAPIFVAGIFAGSLIWWFLLSMTVGALHMRVNPGFLRGINFVSGGLIAIFGVWILFTLIVGRFSA